MLEYYKGNIVNVNNLNSITCQFDLVSENATSFTRIVYQYLSELKDCELDEEKKEHIAKLISDIIKPKITDVHEFPIIYTKIYDECGNEYGRELISNCVFPIGNGHISYSINCSKGGYNELYLDRLSNVVYSATNQYIDYYYIIGDRCERETYMPMAIVDKLMYSSRDDGLQATINNKEYDLVSLLPDVFKINIKPKMKFAKDKRINYAIGEEDKASEIEVQNYLKNIKKGFAKHKRESEYYRVIKKMQVCNVLGDYLFSETKKNSSLIKKI